MTIQRLVQWADRRLCHFEADVVARGIKAVAGSIKFPVVGFLNRWRKTEKKSQICE